MFTGYLAPVFFTCGVCPAGDQVVPAWQSERIPASSANQTVAPSASARARRVGYWSFFHRPTASGFWRTTAPPMLPRPTRKITHQSHTNPACRASRLPAVR